MIVSNITRSFDACNSINESLIKYLVKHGAV